MSQKAVMIRVNSNLVQEIYHSIPDENEAVKLCKDEGYNSNDGTFDGEYLLVEYEWLEIGEGESASDEFIDDELLLSLYDSYGYEDVIKDAFDKEVTVIESGSIEILYSELE